MKIPLSIFAGLAVGIVGYMVYKKMYSSGTTGAAANPANATPAPSGSSTTQPNTTTSAPLIDINTGLVLRKGMRDANGRREIKKLQYILGVTEDGDFGSITENALKNLANRGVSSFVRATNPNYQTEVKLSEIWAYDVPASKLTAANQKYPDLVSGTAPATYASTTTTNAPLYNVFQNMRG